MKWKSINKADAESYMLTWNDRPPEKFDEEYVDLRKHLIDALNHVVLKLDINKQDIPKAGYDFDLLFGLKLYEILTDKFGMNIRYASDDGVWRYLSLHVIPDIVFLRWGLNPGRFWKETRRVWLKTLWWYVYLSWQGDYERTLAVLKGNTTDEIVQLVERSGPYGYRVELCRKIMEYYASLQEDQRKRSSQIFRRVMKLNTARVRVVEPALFPGGEKQYVKELFKYFA